MIEAMDALHGQETRASAVGHPGKPAARPKGGAHMQPEVDTAETAALGATSPRGWLTYKP